jgi:glutathione S-transferase
MQNETRNALDRSRDVVSLKMQRISAGKGNSMQGNRLVIGNRRYSSWSMRGWLAVKLAGLEVEVEVVPLQGGGATMALRGGATPAGLVPYLEHDGARVWESLAICEYCADIAPGLWPEDRIARAHARAAAAEMHAGFRAMRLGMPMNLMRDFEGLDHSLEVKADVARADNLWMEAQATFAPGGVFLYGDDFGLADAMFAPVVARFLTYRTELSTGAAAYCHAVRSHPLVAAWYDDAAREPAAWKLQKYEMLQV